MDERALTIRLGVLFLPDGKGSPLLFAQWRNKVPLQPVQSNAALVDGGLATKYLRDIWAAAFPLRPTMPWEPIANSDGTGTDAFWRVFK